MAKIEVTLLTTMVIGLLIAIILLSLALANIPPLKIDLSPDWTLSIVNAIATTVLVIITALQINEAKKARIEEKKAHEESAKPTLSLEPSNYVSDRNFNWVTLANSGMVAKNVEIDVKYKESIELLYISSIGTSQRVPILKGVFPDNGGIVAVQVKYNDTYDKPYSENLSIDFDSINLNKRHFTYVTSPPDFIALSIEAVASTLANTLSRIERHLPSAIAAIQECSKKLENIEDKLQALADSAKSSTP